MQAIIREVLWKQFGAAIDMLENALLACPDKLWDSNSAFWYRAYHTLFYLDYYLSQEPDKFLPPSPFTLSEFEISGPPLRVYTKMELLDYLNHCRQKCHDLIADLTEEKAEQRWVNQYRNYSMLEILLYNMRHVQHHTAQLNLLLREKVNDAPAWVSRTKAEL
jgi:hypothetical protein